VGRLQPAAAAAAADDGIDANLTISIGHVASRHVSHHSSSFLCLPDYSLRFTLQSQPVNRSTFYSFACAPTNLTHTTALCILAELTLGKVLGKGGFCSVNEITSITLGHKAAADLKPEHPLSDEHQIHNIVQDRSFMSTHCIREGRDYRYAIKHLLPANRKEASLYVNGVVDLAVEARFLSVIRHPNIIKMRAMSSGSPYDGQFFVVLDRLYDTMTVRLTKWKRNQVKGIRKLMDRKGRKEMAFWIERITVAYDLSCALKHLHDMQ
jgi:hypothetical protein